MQINIPTQRVFSFTVNIDIPTGKKSFNIVSYTSLDDLCGFVDKFIQAHSIKEWLTPQGILTKAMFGHLKEEWLIGSLTDKQKITPDLYFELWCDIARDVAGFDFDLSIHKELNITEHKLA